MTDPASLLRNIEADCEALDKASKALAEFNDDDALANAEIAYEDAMDAALIEAEEFYKDSGGRSSEQMREARARQNIEPGLRGEYLRLKRRKENIQAWGKLRESALSGRQSELSFLKSEGNAPPGPDWSQRRAA